MNDPFTTSHSSAAYVRLFEEHLDQAAAHVYALRFHPALPKGQDGTLDRVARALRDAREAINELRLSE